MWVQKQNSHCGLWYSYILEGVAWKIWKYPHLNVKNFEATEVQKKICLYLHLNWKWLWNRWDSLWSIDYTASQNCKVRAVCPYKLLCSNFRLPVNIHWNSLIFFLIEGLYPFINCSKVKFVSLASEEYEYHFPFVFCGFISFLFRVCRCAVGMKKQGKELLKEENHESLF